MWSILIKANASFNYGGPIFEDRNCFGLGHGSRMGPKPRRIVLAMTSSSYWTKTIVSKFSPSSMCYLHGVSLLMWIPFSKGKGIADV
jgi:hypothetical protein